MAINVPRRNLGGEAEPWGRSVDERLLKQQGAIDLLQTDVKNSFKGVNASVSGISRALSTVQAQQEELEHQQEALEEQQNKLEEQTNKLTKTITGLPNHQIRTNTDSIGTITTSTSNISKTMSIKMPSAHNYVWILISYYGFFQIAPSDAGTSLYIRTYVDIDGTNAGYLEAGYYLNNAMPVVSPAPMHQVGLLVNPGSTIRTRTAVFKTVEGTSFYNKDLSATLSILSYSR